MSDEIGTNDVLEFLDLCGRARADRDALRDLVAEREEAWSKVHDLLLRKTHLEAERDAWKVDANRLADTLLLSTADVDFCAWRDSALAAHDRLAAGQTEAEQ